MEEIQLKVQIRQERGKKEAKNMRREEFIPAVVYGGESGPTAIKINQPEYEKVMRHHQGQNVVFHLNVLEGEKKLRDYSTLLKEEQRDPVSNALLHIDFLRISLTKEIEVKVALESKGEPEGVKKDGGSLEHNLWELDIVCLPTNIPEKIQVDVSALNIGDAIHIKDIVLPEGTKTNHDPDTIVFTVVPPMKEEEEAGEGEVEGGEAEPEVIKKEKKSGEGDAAQEASEG